MRRAYTTRQGDMRDSIAFSQLGGISQTDRLMNINQQYLEYYIFPAGIELELPDVDPAASIVLPPWKVVAG